MSRKGLALGTGKGYKNIIGVDPRIHSQSAQGIKQAQHIHITTVNPNQYVKPTLNWNEIKLKEGKEEGILKYFEDTSGQNVITVEKELSDTLSDVLYLSIYYTYSKDNKRYVSKEKFSHSELKKMSNSQLIKKAFFNLNKEIAQVKFKKENSLFHQVFQKDFWI